MSYLTYIQDEFSVRYNKAFDVRKQRAHQLYRWAGVRTVVHISSVQNNQSPDKENKWQTSIHMSDLPSLLAAWKETGVIDPTYARTRFLVEFKKIYGKVPFGNTNANIKR